MKYITKSKIPSDAKIENDMILSVNITRNRGFILGLHVKFKSGRQCPFCGYHNTPNIGYMIFALAELLDVNPCGECSDILDAFNGTPCRVASNGIGGDICADTTWIGHFMDDKFAFARSIIHEGFGDEGGTI